jgi:hypothetical protein
MRVSYATLYIAIAVLATGWSQALPINVSTRKNLFYLGHCTEIHSKSSSQLPSVEPRDKYANGESKGLVLYEREEEEEVPFDRRGAGSKVAAVGLGGTAIALLVSGGLGITKALGA